MQHDGKLTDQTDPSIDADLAVNRTGKLNPRQRRQYIAARSAEHALGILVILFVIAVLVHILRLAPSLTVIAVLV